MSILNNIEIEKILKNLNIKNVNIITKDELKNFIYNKNNKFIINMDNSDGNGTHWVSLINNYYFDSYGIICPNEIINYNKNIYYSDNNIQTTTDTNCGWYSLMFIIYFNDIPINKYSFEKFLKQFNNYNNDNILINFFNNLL